MAHWQRRKLVRWTGGALLAGTLPRLCLPALANTSTAADAVMLDEARTDHVVAHVAILLPLHSTLQGSAAQAVRAGLLAAHGVEGLAIQLHVIATNDTPATILAAYSAASQQYDLIIGPLSRAAVALIVRQGRIVTPTIALASPEGAEQATAAHAGVLMTGMPVEEEARQIAHWMHEHATDGDALAVAGQEVWQQRAAHAWVAQANRLGLRARVVTLPVAALRLQPGALSVFKRRLDNAMPAQLFAALSMEQTQQLRRELGTEIPVYGTSHLNPFMVDRQYGQTYPLLDGVRLLDIPWQLPGGSRIVTRYPPIQGYFGARPTVDQRRLYALGIDAYRIAQAIVAGSHGFELDGVTGQLTVALHTGGVTYFQRQYVRAAFRDGNVVRIGGQFP